VYRADAGACTTAADPPRRRPDVATPDGRTWKDEPAMTHTTMLPADHPINVAGTGNSSLGLACRGQRRGPRPIWFMRQAGRSLPEYRDARRGIAMLDSCLLPELAAEITLQPVRRHGVDAAVLFSDIVVPLKLAGIDVEIVPGVGPVVANPVRTAADIRRLPELDPGALAPVEDAIRICTAELGPTPLLGFAGAPFTLASYLVEGGPSREHLVTKAMMYAEPQAWSELAGWVARTTAAFLRAQVLAGASAVQLFDSWAGGLSLANYTEHVAEHSATVLAAVADLEVPRIHFGVGTGELLPAMRDVGATVIGVDHRIPLDVANSRLGGSTPLQGNIDPAALFAGRDALHRHTLEVLRRGDTAPGHIVNLGHGVPPDTDPDVLTELVAFVHDQP
jgi:uroporphyrinogen decarboxylase